MSVLLRSLHMASDLKDFIKTYDGLMEPRFCQRVIDNFEKKEENQERVDRERRPTFTELNISKQYQKKDPDWIPAQVQMQEKFIECVERYMEELDVASDFPTRYAFEEYRIKRYLPKHDEFKDHVDVGDHSSARRFLVCFLYLNDVEAGGETNFPNLSYSIKPKCGRILLFPPLWLYRHAGTPVISGKKYIAGSYLHYL